MATLGHSQQSPQIEVEMDRKAQREGEKMLRSQWEHSDVYNNFATPLPGTFLNLPQESCLLQCPSCGVKDMTKIVLELHHSDWEAILHCCFCWCCKKDELCQPIDQLMANHYCKHCGCYFGEHARVYKVSI